ncbi:MAG: tRNA 2-thiouridine(34) synthase MnmA [Gammaproteobacteria bacterium]|nr:tRNA 2-thiouridine(34) synthase MnmA [Gammaproteobacteria bacterium]MDH5345445.1 tRNA 2-thiouridine(34) synthase MnmA [Gammaproteobacteria bacterium]
MSFDTPDIRGKRIVIGLSGGVDSAVAALLLRDAGADVHALHMTNWEDDGAYCTAAADLQDARHICEQLDIPLHHVNFAREYRNQVFSCFLDEYRAGRTPNPDVLCNREIKFGVFRDYAKRLGGGPIATGHYARSAAFKGSVALLKATDKSKDQSYFLHAVSAAALAETLFPLGDLLKSEVRAIARERALEVHDKKDSTGICFIGERPFREFLSQYVPALPGPIRTPEGKTVGEHRGLAYYTLGQRHGLGIGGRRDAGDAPWYVAAKDPAENALIVVQGNHPLRYSSALITGAASWINGVPDELAAGRTLACAVKIRYRQPDQRCTVAAASAGALTVSFEAAQADVTPGQFAVFYDGDRCLGGAVIDRAVRKVEALPRAG